MAHFKLIVLILRKGIWSVFAPAADDGKKDGQEGNHRECANRSPPEVGRESLRSSELHEEVNAQRKHDEQGRKAAWAIPGLQRDVHLEAVHQDLRHRKIGNEDVVPDPLVAENAYNVERIGTEYINGNGAELVQRIDIEVLFLSEKTLVGSCRESAREYVFLKLMEEQCHKEKDHISLHSGKLGAPDAHEKGKSHKQDTAEGGPIPGKESERFHTNCFSELCITKVQHIEGSIIILFNGKVYDSYDYDVYLQKSPVK